MEQRVLSLLTEGLKLNVAQRGLLIRVGWISLVSFHIFWVCGWLSVLGLSPPFAQASDIQQSAARTDAKISPAIETLKLMLQSKIDELDDGVALETLRKTSQPGKWTELDELKLSQLRRRLQQERENLSELIGKTGAKKD